MVDMQRTYAGGLELESRMARASRREWRGYFQVQVG